MSTQELCPLCGEGQVTQHREDAEQTYGGQTGPVPMYFRSCSHCGSDFAGAEESLLNKRAMMAFRKRVDGLLPAAHVAALRGKLCITQAQAAKLFGGGPVAFSKYETDDVAQSSAMDTLLRLVEANESSFWTLVDQKGMRADFVRTQAQPAQSSHPMQPLTASEGPSPLYEPVELKRPPQDNPQTGQTR